MTFKNKIKKSFLGPFARRIYQEFSIFRPKRSYSQIGEDLILDYLLKYKKNGFYVDVGAYHPIHISNTYKFYKRGWTGIQIEPNYERFLLFKKYRPNSINLNIGIGEKEGLAEFYNYEDSAYSTFSIETVELNKKLNLQVSEIKKVPILRIGNVFSKYIKDQAIDFMSVDTEGLDLEVLKTNDWNLYRPHLIIVETTKTSDKIFGEKINNIYDPFMEGIGYKKIADTYLNSIYIDKAKMNY